MDNSVITQHWWEREHQVHFAEMKMLFRSANWHMRMNRGSLEIALTKQSLNQEFWAPRYKRDVDRLKVVQWRATRKVKRVDKSRLGGV